MQRNETTRERSNYNNLVGIQICSMQYRNAQATMMRNPSAAQQNGTRNDLEYEEHEINYRMSEKEANGHRQIPHAATQNST
jgi:hypothetical protein